MPLYRVHAYDDEHYATLVNQAETAEQAGAIARQFVAMMHLGFYPANHQREFPEIVRVEHAASYFDAAEPFLPVVESVEEVDEESPAVRCATPARLARRSGARHSRCRRRHADHSRPSRDAKMMSPAPGLTEADLETLDAFLMSDQVPDDCMQLSDLDGFLTAVAIGPELIMPSEWLPAIWGDGEPEF